MADQNLLPVGFYDLIFEEAEKSHQDSVLAISYLMQSNYRLIKPPLIEFDSTFKETNDSDYLVTTDSISGKKIALRSDITLQIGRILTTRLKNYKLPIKLCYIGDVIKTKSVNLYADRQQTQIGFEIIGIDNEKNNLILDFVVIEDSIQILQKIRVENFSFKFSLPDFLHIFLEDAAIKNQQILKKAILQKNLSEIKRICPEYSDILSKIVRCQDNLTNLSDLITAKINSNKIQFELNRAKQIESFFAKKYNKIPIIFDLFGDQDIKYHQDIYFEIFVPRFSYSIARGGRYNIATSDKNIKAIGSTIYLNNLRKINASYNS